MTAVRAPVAPVGWQQVVPAGRRYLTLPGAAEPVLVCDASRPVVRYACRTLLAAPPGSRVPAWVFGAARRLLAQPGVGRLAPSAVPPAGAGTALAARLDADGYRVALLDHSHDPDKRLIALLFPAGAEAPLLAVKVAVDPAGAARLRAERDRLRALHEVGVSAVRRTAPRLVDLPGLQGAAEAGELLVTTAAGGTPMFVTYYRGRHTRNPAAVRADFTAAGVWLAELHARPTGPVRDLELAPGLELATAALDDGDAARVRRALDELQRRLRQHQVADRLVHGDFWPGNLLVAHGVLRGVVDWERWSPAGSPVRDLARFAAAYSLYLDRRTPPGRRVAGHPGLRAGDPGGGVGYALDGAGWYPRLVRNYLRRGLQRLGLDPGIGRDIVLAELAANAAESTSAPFAAGLWRTFLAVSRAEP